MNTGDATPTELATAQSGSMVAGNAPHAPDGANFDLVLEAVAGRALGSSGAPYTLTISAIDLTAVSQPWPPQTLHQRTATEADYNPRRRDWLLTITSPKCKHWSPDGPGIFKELRELRRVLDPAGIRQAVNGVRHDVWPPGTYRLVTIARTFRAKPQCGKLHVTRATAIPGPGG